MADREPMGASSIGSNDIHLLVATSDGTATFERQVNHSVLAELVGAEKQGVLPASAISHALHDLETLVAAAREALASPIIALATEALREAANGAALLELVGTTFGIQTALLSGEEEAALDYTWATFPTLPPAPLLVVDSGGGSTQVIQGSGPRPAAATSLPIGGRTHLPLYLSWLTNAVATGLTIVCVSADELARTRAFSEELHLTVPVLVAPREQNAFLDDYRVSGTPASCLLDEQGTVLAAGLPSEYDRSWQKLLLHEQAGQLQQDDSAY